MSTSAYRTALTEAGLDLTSIQDVTAIAESDEATTVLEALSDVLEAHLIEPEVVAETEDGRVVAGETGALIVDADGVSSFEFDLAEAYDDDEEDDEDDDDDVEEESSCGSKSKKYGKDDDDDDDVEEADDEDDDDDDEEDDETDEDATPEDMMDFLSEHGLLADPDMRLVQQFDEAREAGNMLLMLDAFGKLVVGNVSEEALVEYRKMTSSALRQRAKSAKKLARDPQHQRALKKRRKAYKKDKQAQKKAARWKKRFGGRNEEESVEFVSFMADIEEARDLVEIAALDGLERFVDIIEDEDGDIEVHIAEELLEAIDVWAEDSIDEMETPGHCSNISLTRFVGDKSFLKDAGPSGESCPEKGGKKKKNESIDEATPGSEANPKLKQDGPKWSMGKPEGKPAPMAGLTSPKGVKPAKTSSVKANPIKHSTPHDYTGTYDKSINYTYEDVNTDTLRNMLSIGFRADKDEVLEGLATLAGEVEGPVIWTVAEDEDDNMIVLFFEEVDRDKLDEVFGDLDIELVEEFDLDAFIDEDELDEMSPGKMKARLKKRTALKKFKIDEPGSKGAKHSKHKLKGKVDWDAGRPAG